MKPVRRYLPAILLSAAFAGVFSWFCTQYLLVPIYRCEATAVVTGKVVQEGKLVENLLLDERYLETFHSLVTGDTVKQLTINKLRLGWSLAYLSRMLHAEANLKTGILRLYADDSDPERTQDLVEAYLYAIKKLCRNNPFPLGIEVIDPPQISKEPVRPILAMNLIWSILGGLFVGILGSIRAWSLEADSFQNPLARHFPTVPVLGFLPNCIQYNRTRSMRALLANQIRIQALSRIRKHMDHLIPSTSMQKILFCSSLSREGATTVLTQIAYDFAQEGEQILLIDFNRMRPGLYRFCQHQEQKSIGNLPIYRRSDSVWVAITNHPHIDAIFDFMIAERNPVTCSDEWTDLLDTLCSQYDRILIDCPPLLVSDCTLELTKLAHAVILVADHRRLSHPILEESIRRLEEHNAPTFALIHNRKPIRRLIHQLM